MTDNLSDDFQALAESGEPVGASRQVGAAIAAARDAVARQLIAIGATPNRITILGFVLTCGAGYCLGRGAGEAVPYFNAAGETARWWPALAALLLVLAGACDMLDGAVARLGGLRSRAGAILDSSIDRLSDIAIYLGCFLYFATRPMPNLTYQVLAVVALCNSVLISYIKARAENVIEDCSVGYWLRGERFAAMLIGCTTGHVPAVLWQMAVSGFFTVWRRMTYAYAVLRGADRGGPLPARGPVPGWMGRLQLWRRPRGSVSYDVVTGAHIAYIVFVPLFWPMLRAAGPHADPLRQWLGL
jgi:CDP-diacylglycerol--glycerol-3-phosphate 3-phosphatidyltransferase